jgi:hypothetical protein
MALSTIAKEIRTAWHDSAPLTATAALMLGAFVVSAAGIVLDDRIITGVPAWLKPAKFAISTAIFCGTLAWLYRYISVWPRFVAAMGWVIAAVLVLEVAIIDFQAARGTTSHFNVGTAFDGLLFSIMGAAIGILWLASVGVLAALFKQKFADGAWGWWLRMGMLTTVLGAAAGGLMIRMTPEQAEALNSNQVLHAVGGHTVGEADGGAGLPGVGWSTTHGDLRVPHFFGLHGLQLLPFIGWVLSGGLPARGRGRQAGLAFVGTASYLGFIAILTWQALRGQSIVAPDAATLYAFGIWLGATAVAGVSLTFFREGYPSATRTTV